MSEQNVITLTRHKNGRTTITGLTDGDLRLISWAVDAGSFEAGDRGGDLSQALLRLARALRVPPSFGGHVEIIGGTPDRTVLFEEPVNLGYGR